MQETGARASSDQMLGLAGQQQLSPHRREVFCEGLFLVLKLSPHMSARAPHHRHQHFGCRANYVSRGHISRETLHVLGASRVATAEAGGADRCA